jgi:hypothetical protein
MASFRDSIRAIAVEWLLDEVNEKILFACGLMIDGIAEWCYLARNARYPDICPPDALSHLGNDRQIERGPNQTVDGYRVQIRRAFDTWANAGGGRTILGQLAAYFVGAATPPMRLVSDAAVWHEYDWTTGLVTKTVVGDNWEWDANTGVRWWRGWAIIDSSDGPWENDGLWGDPGTWGDGGTWGSTATSEEVAAIRRVVNKWKPGNVYNVDVIVVFDSGILRRTDTSPPNPSGNGADPVWRMALDAAFWPGLVDT